MPFMRRRNPDTGKRDWKGALEDATILFLVTLVFQLLGYGYPPSPQALYTSILTALATFMVAIQRRFGIELPEKVKPIEEG